VLPPGPLDLPSPGLAFVISLLPRWDAASNLNDILVRQFKRAFELAYFQFGLVQSASYLGYLLPAIPARMFMRRHGYKRGIGLARHVFSLECSMDSTTS